MEEKYKDLKLGERGAIISIAAYLCLAALKLIIGFLFHSEALSADGLNNTTDIFASIAVLIGLRISQRPPDHNHRYGHWKSENIASMVASFIMMVVGLQVLYQAAISIFTPSLEAPDLIAAWTAAFGAVVMYFVYLYNRKLARKINSQSVMAAAKDNLSDAWVSIGTIIGIVGAQFHLPWLDPLAAFVVGIIICKTAWGIFSETSHHLTDGFDEEKLELYRGTIEEVYGVKGIKDIKARNYGNNTVVDIIILVNSKLGIQEAHDISCEVEKALRKTHDVYDVHVHVEPH
ncbi:cation diffusion facilitator family transporter [Metabacillus fastidiosus]|uniref:cation diffusion facilitator family transporter n=1 Tax=Metabacillus fastidiosus TaxID=1458 RepID=UPI002DBAC429|nr:cation diffusion facilitator family transporter [Metabacillus fastidiosus]MEC2075230.1 cation diffusion facilitator family transporter [Metabacillus fastidiosus]